MKEVKNTRKPLIFYYVIALIVLMLLNALVFPRALSAQVEEVDYGVFLQMADAGNISEAQVTDTEIIFADKDSPTNYYKTGRMDDIFLVQRLYDAGIVQFGTPIIEQMSPILSFLLTWVLPIVIFIGIGQWMSKKMMDRAGGPNFSCLLRGDTDTDRSAGSRDSEETARESPSDSEREPAETGRAGRLSV